MISNIHANCGFWDRLYYIRAPYDFALRPEGVSELLSKGIEVNDVFDKEFLRLARVD